MFTKTNNSKLKSLPENVKEQNRISSGTIITGDISSKGAFRIEGTLKGNLKAGGKVVISKGGNVEGDMECRNADFEGTFTGKIHVEETLTLRPEAVIKGEVATAKLVIEPGATFNATCKMLHPIKTLKNDGKRGKQGEEKSA
ncbi:MAG: polymer-forming cytoskeletal protein [Gillisia sp.]